MIRPAPSLIMPVFESPRPPGREFLDTIQGNFGLHKQLSRLPRHEWRGLRSMRVRLQRGATLIIAMILLLVMSLLAVTSMRGTLVQERMSSNTHDHDLAFQSSEAGLRMGERQAENWVHSGANPTNLADCQNPSSGGLYRNINASCARPLWEGPPPGENGSFWHDAGTDVAGGDNIRFTSEGLSLAPFYIVELISDHAPCQIDNPDTNTNCRRFRITASSRTADGRAQVMLQSIYATE